MCDFNAVNMADQTNEILRTLPVQFQETPLLEQTCPSDPLELFQSWMQAAMQHQPGDPNAMVLSTATVEGQPVSRVVLLKEFSERGFVFYTNYSSHKAEQIAKNPLACLLFYWHALGRQVRLEGHLHKVPTKESDEYFQSRPRDSQIGAHASPQSQVVSDRAYLEKRFHELKTEFGSEQTIPRPNHWGGYVLLPELFEFWQGRTCRLHDRLIFKHTENSWTRKRLAP